MRTVVRDAVEVFAIVIVLMLLLGFNFLFTGWFPFTAVDLFGAILLWILRVVIALIMLFVEAVILIGML